VYDATFGSNSLNNSTPSDSYIGTKCVYSFPKIEDYRRIIIKCGTGCFLWKRDLSRYYLQLPLCPVEYCRVGAIWRCCLFFFVGLMFGLRYSGLNGQRVTDAVSWIHRYLGLEYTAAVESEQSGSNQPGQPKTQDVFQSPIHPTFNC
jgi:hypothetical protein